MHEMDRLDVHQTNKVLSNLRGWPQPTSTRPWILNSTSEEGIIVLYNRGSWNAEQRLS